MSDTHDAHSAKDKRRTWPVPLSLAGYRSEFLTGDLIAGVTLVAIAIPEQMATARLGNFAPQIGFFAFMAGSLAFALFGASRFVSSGADSTITPIFASGIAFAAGTPEYAGLAAALALMVGGLLVAAGWFRLGWIADLLSVPVTTGFLAGIAVHIVISQLPSVLGVTPPTGDSMLARFATIAAHAGDTNPFTLTIGVAVLAAILVAQHIDARIPGALIGLVAATVAVVLFGLEDRGVATLGAIPSTWPVPKVPAASIDGLIRIIPLALIIAVTVMVQTAATTRAFPSQPDEAPDVDRDFVGVGAGSLLAGMFGAFPVDASPPRTAIVSASGGRSQVAGLVAAAIILALVVAGAGLLRHVPQAALGGVLMFVAYHIVRGRLIVTIFRRTFGEFLLVAATAAAIIVLPIEVGVGVGIGLSLLHGIWSTTRSRIVFFERVPGTSIWWPKNPHERGETEPGVIVAGLPAPLSFLNAYDFGADVRNALRASAEPVRLFVLEATGIVEIDFTAAQVLVGIIKECDERGIAFAIARLESLRARAALDRFHVHDVLHPDRLFRSVEEAIRALAPREADG